MTTMLLWTALCLAVVFVDGRTTYKVGVIENPPFVMRNGDDNVPVGYIPNMLEELAPIIDADYEWSWVDSYGSLHENGSWDGLINQVITGEVDIGAAAMTITSVRLRVVDFSRSYMNAGISVVMKLPKATGTNPNYFFILKPFSATVWFLFFICFVLFCICMFLLNKFHPFEHKAAFTEGCSSEKEARALDAGGSCWLACTLTVLQGFDRAPRSKAGKVLFVVWGCIVLASVILYAVASVQVYQQGPARRRARMPDSLDDVMASGDAVGYVEGGSTSEFFRTSRISFYQRVYSRAEGVRTLSAGLERVRQGDFAMLLESSTLEYELGQPPCDLMQVGGNLNAIEYGFVFQKDSELKQQVDLALLELQEDGLLAKLRRKHWYEKGQCAVPVKMNSGGPAVSRLAPRPVTATEYTGVMVFYIIGLIMVALVALLEVMFDKFKNRPTKEKQEKLVDAEEGQALNQTVMSDLNDSAAPERAPTDAEDAATPAGPVGVELEPEDKEKEEKKPVPEDDPDRIEHISGPVEVKA